METADAIIIGRDLMMVALLLSAPVVIVSLLVGVTISIMQTVTSIQEQTLTFAPRIVAVVAIVIFLTPWYLSTLKNFTMRMFEKVAETGM
ncbi:MAG TPA: flagellar biosynthesis protein FliQ [Pirellulaceae bacterium]|nr:flagellar biosynthesis protein FliQ [Pirellulaceae bacterium]HMO92870.1 flagellar biosynthesis protein FliQ [Pirellulaceae bacterium]HMP71097.1 flagellar biosynthesis protein FliQ [Pirellulaceae bacterium]